MKNDQTLEALFGTTKLQVVHTATSAALGQSKSDVGTYSYELNAAATTTVSTTLSNYDIQAIAAGKYEVKQDTITITVFPADAEVIINDKPVKVMQRFTVNLILTVISIWLNVWKLVVLLLMLSQKQLRQ